MMHFAATFVLFTAQAANIAKLRDLLRPNFR
jgi:hypothetical protein